MKKLLSVLMIIALMFSFSMNMVQAEEGDTVITIIHTNDQHGRVNEGSSDGMGFSRIATIKDELLAKNPNTLLVDAGDVLHGTTFATLEQGASVVEVMNAVGYDIMVPGNHDFNYGKDRLLELAKLADFDVINANVMIEADGTNFLTPYVIKEIGGKKIGFFGLTSPETTFKTHPDNVKGLSFEAPVEIAKKMVEELKDKTDVIVCVAHLGLDESTKAEERSSAIAEEVDGIDLIIDAHSHTVLETGKIVNGTLIVSAGEYNKNVGVVNMVVKADGTVTVEASLITKETAVATYAEKEAVKTIITDISAGQAEILSEVVGKTTVALDGVREHVRAQETNLGNLIADSMLAETGADIAITNGGGIRASIDVGDITKGEIITVLPFGNYVVTKKVTGQAIKDALENGVTDYPATKGAFLQVGGLTFEFNADKPAGQRVENVKVKGVALDLTKTYTVAMNNFMAVGGDGYTMFKDYPILTEYSALDEVLIDYIVSLGSAAPKVENRIVVKQTPVVEEPVAPATTFYVVQAGDCLWKIARNYGMTWQELNALNNLKNPNLIFVNQKLVVPVK